LLPPKHSFADITNSDPVTGQAAWYDLCVKITPALDGESGAWPQFESVDPLPNQPLSAKEISYSTHQNVNIKRSLKDILTRGKR
jgi:hypothetical protein